MNAAQSCGKEIPHIPDCQTGRCCRGKNSPASGFTMLDTIPIAPERIAAAHRPDGIRDESVLRDSSWHGMDADTAIWFWIGPHGEYEKLLKKKD